MRFGMKYLRTKAKKLSLLALFALAMQFGLSFGHVHHDAARAEHSEISDHAPASTPDTDHDSKDHRDLCAICVTAALANVLIGAPPPVLPLPIATELANAFPSPEATVAGFRRFGFQSRAPPRS